MSVLLNRRRDSKMEYVNTACNIHDEVINFLSRLSARYSRLFTERTAEVAGLMMDHAVEAENIYPNNRQRLELRAEHLIEAKAALAALDVRLLRIYNVLKLNPKGAFSHGNDKGDNRKQLTVDDALRRLEHMAETIGLMIASEEKLLEGTMTSDRKKFREEHPNE